MCFFSRTQKQTAMSSCEAEYISLAAGTSEAMYVKRIVEFLWGGCSGIEVYCDSSSARQLAKKKGVSSIRHLDLKLLFVQRLLEDKQFDLKPIAGLKNPSDISTKAVDRQTLERYFVILGLATLPDGDEKVAQRAASVSSSTSWSAIARIAVMLGSLPAVKRTEVEPVEKEYSLFDTVFVTILVMMLSLGFWLGRATKRVKETRKLSSDRWAR